MNMDVWAADTTGHEAKRAAVLALAAEQGRESLLLRSAASLGWYLEGARVQVNPIGEPVVAVHVHPDGDVLRVFGNERRRFETEELTVPVTVCEVPWYGQLDDVQGAPLAEMDVAGEIARMRRTLAPADRERYRALGRDAAAALTVAVDAVRPGWTERQLAAATAAALVERGIEPLVLLVAGADRLHHRHPLPTGAPLGRRAMLVACARRHGLIANLTRWLHEGSLTDDEADAERRILAVEADVLAATVPGATLGSVLERVAEAYPRHGFAPGEWRNHHQGGPTGFLGRDPRATPGAREIVELGQAFAWNPTAPAAKVEDTILLGEDGFEPLTVDPAWPTIEVGGLARPVSRGL